MEIKFDVYFKKNLGTLFKSNEVDLNGKHAHVNMPLALVDRMEVNYDMNEMIKLLYSKIHTLEKEIESLKGGV